ncbi:acyltransferase family protein [Paenibacillus sp. CF384]|uniref:acyltransferase family protein n=1 Tax=Paenibacillus sp. CF384 TaxID=1884382 RepID=UPI00089CFBD7|nr:acyltransferase family protein [Paenibacillus sp. CF384]SDX08056.1 Membrane-bound acyltransferase YfiQ, involved in biofilm formation [Paenibacillus sp. CF384]
MGKVSLKEVFLIRTVACLSIVFLHSVDVADGWFFGGLRLLLSFGTPAFILISEIVLANAYPTHTPHGFLRKRLRYIAIPYTCFVIIYSFQNTFATGGNGDISALVVNLFKGFVLGETSAYFVAIIFQFYLLHMFFVRYVFNRFRPQWILLIAGSVNILYLAFFNLISPPNHPTAIYIWDTFYRMPFIGWVFYFVVAYYVGIHYMKCLDWLRRYQYYIYTLVALTGLTAIYLLVSDIIPVISSKRFDMIFFTLSTVFMLLIIAAKLRVMPSFIVRISQYSFGIYLIHPLVLFVVDHFLDLPNNMIGASILFIFALGGSMGTVAVLNQFSWGSYIIGRIGVGLDLKRPTNRITKEKTQPVN